MGPKKKGSGRYTPPTARRPPSGPAPGPNGLSPHMTAMFRNLLVKHHEVIAETGWSVQSVFPSQEQVDAGDHVQWSYTIGLGITFGHPEVVVFGLGPDTATAVLNDLGDLVKNGTSIEPYRLYDDVVNLPVMFLPVEQTEAEGEGYFTQARNIYGDRPFTFVQLVWPDAAGQFPWDHGFDKKLRAIQPLLGPAPHA